MVAGLLLSPAPCWPCLRPALHPLVHCRARWTFGPVTAGADTYGGTPRPRASLQPESCADRCMAGDRTRQTAAKLHTAGPNIPDRDIRLDLLGPTAFGSGPSRSQESDADLSGLDRVEGGGYGEPNRDGPGSTKMCRYGEWRYMAMSHVTVRGDRTASRRPFIRGPLRVCESPL